MGTAGRILRDFARRFFFLAGSSRDDHTGEIAPPPRDG